MVNKKKEKLKYKFIYSAFIILMLLLAQGCSYRSNQEASDITGKYIINTRTGRIHSLDCQYVAKMSDRNKKVSNDTLTSLLQKEYVICRKCRAGMKMPLIQEAFDRLLHRNLYVDDVNINASYEDYIRAIDSMGEWYINHVPTYASKIEEESLQKYRGDLENYNKIQLKDKASKKSEYYVITDDVNSNNIEKLKPDTQILRAKESAAKNYQDKYDSIKFEKRIAYYPCNEISPKSKYNMPGDDCVRYIFAVFSMMDEEFASKYEELTKKKYSNTSSEMLTRDTGNIAFGLINLGFQIYDVKDAKVDVNKDSNIEGYIFRIDDNFVLKKGDILSRNGHVHIYLGDGKAIEASNFGWGRVYRDYPQVYDIYISKNTDGENNIVLINSAGKEEIYTRVYRYIGNMEGE